MTTCVILQPSYIPWRGYFHLIQRADVFVFYDDVQYDKHGWRNRNRVKTANGTQWLTIPVNASGNVESGLLLKDARIANASFAKKHLSTLKQTYARAPFLSRYAGLLESFYTKKYALLCDFTIDTTRALAAELGIDKTKFVRSSELMVTGERTARLVEIVKRVGATHYISGPSAKDYLDEAAFASQGMTMEWMKYDYTEYEQLHPPFDPFVTVLDLLFMKGAAAPEYIWGKSAP